jgi:hypothetical protein
VRLRVRSLAPENKKAVGFICSLTPSFSLLLTFKLKEIKVLTILALWWFTPVILTPWNAEIRRIVV